MPLRLTVTQRALAAGIAAAGLLIGAFAAGSARGDAATVPGRTLAAQAAAPGARITVTGTGTVSGSPDQLMLYLGVQAHGPSVSAALQQANRAARAVTGALTRAGVRGSDIQTSGLSVQPDYTGGSPVPSGYGASESVDVTLRTLAAAGTQISAAVRAGGDATRVDGVSLNLNDTSSLLAAARAKAAADARAKAAQYARALGMSLGPVVSVSEPHPAPMPPVFAAASAAGAVPSPVPVSPGRQPVTVTVTAVFALA
ncbi:MAG TPA: SIMPL domain-containing protein [Streptosporangiaceae bacterium]|jgi:uncharacterized protein YggE